jgi:hypothetical protein
MLKGNRDSYWDPARDPGKSRLIMTVQPVTPGCETSGAFWVKYPYPLVVLEIEARLEAEDHVYYGEEVPVNNAPSSMIYCPKEEDDVASAVECLWSAAGTIPIIVLGSRLDPQLDQRVLLAGATGIVHLLSYSGQGASFLTAAFEDKTAISRDFLKAILAEAASRTGPIVLTSGQRQFLDLVIQAPIVADHIMVPKELLRAFLVEVEGRSEEEPFSDIGCRSPIA